MIQQWRSKSYEVLIDICVEWPSAKSDLLGGEMEVCDCSGCVQGLRILLNVEGNLTLPIFV